MLEIMTYKHVRIHQSLPPGHSQLYLLATSQVKTSKGIVFVARYLKPKNDLFWRTRLKDTKMYTFFVDNWSVF